MDLLNLVSAEKIGTCAGLDHTPNCVKPSQFGFSPASMSWKTQVLPSFEVAVVGPIEAVKNPLGDGFTHSLALGTTMACCVGNQEVSLSSRHVLARVSWDRPLWQRNFDSDLGF